MLCVHFSLYPQLERTFAEALKSARGFYVKEMVQDGACLFRAVGMHLFCLSLPPINMK